MKLKKIFALSAIAVTLSSSMAFANVEESTLENQGRAIGAGTDHTFTTELPNNYQNNWFKFRTKETHNKDVRFRMTSKPSKCSGMTVWVENSNKVRITNIYTNLGTLNYTYKLLINDAGSAMKGKSVRLGFEDADKTTISKHTVKGIVNYQ